MTLQWQIGSETNLVLFFPKPISLDKQKKCWALADIIETMPEVIEVIIGMNTLSVFSHPLAWDEFKALQNKLTALLEEMPEKIIDGKHIEIPVHYGGK